AVPLILGVVAINFTLIHMAPGDPATLLAGEFADAQAVERLRQEFGLDEPFYVQFGHYLVNIVTGDLGYSYRFRAPVLDLVLERLPNTLLLLFVSFSLSMIVAVLLAALSARRPNSLLDNTASSIA